MPSAMRTSESKVGNPGYMAVVVEVPDPAELEEFGRIGAYKNLTRGGLYQKIFLAKMVGPRSQGLTRQSLGWTMGSKGEWSGRWSRAVTACRRRLQKAK